MNKNKSVLEKYKNKKALHTSLFEVKEIVEDVKNHNISSLSSPNKNICSGPSSPKLNKYRSNNDPDLDDDTDIQTILTADDDVKHVLSHSKNVSKSLVQDIKEFIKPNYDQNNMKNETFDQYAKQSSSRLNHIKRDLDQYMHDFKNKELEKSVSLQRINSSMSVNKIEKYSKNYDENNKMKIERSLENINGNQNGKIIKFLYWKDM